MTRTWWWVPWTGRCGSAAGTGWGFLWEPGAGWRGARRHVVGTAPGTTAIGRHAAMPAARASAGHPAPRKSFKMGTRTSCGVQSSVCATPVKRWAAPAGEAASAATASARHSSHAIVIVPGWRTVTHPAARPAQHTDALMVRRVHATRCKCAWARADPMWRSTASFGQLQMPLAPLSRFAPALQLTPQVTARAAPLGDWRRRGAPDSRH